MKVSVSNLNTRKGAGTNHLSQIFTNYIEKFEYINNTEHHENYKWLATKKFRELMDAALAANTDEFAALLYKAKVASANIIDSRITPFNGMVDFARRDPETVPGIEKTTRIFITFHHFFSVFPRPDFL